MDIVTLAERVSGLVPCIADEDSKIICRHDFKADFGVLERGISYRGVEVDKVEEIPRVKCTE